MGGILKRVCDIELKEKADEGAFHFEEPGVEDITGKQLAGMGVIAVVLGAFIAWLANRFGNGGSGGGGGGGGGETAAAAKEIAAKVDVTTTSIKAAAATKPTSKPIPTAVATSINKQTQGQSLSAAVNTLVEQGKQTSPSAGAPKVTQDQLWSAVIEAKVASLISDLKIPALMGKGLAEFNPMSIAVAMLDRPTVISQYEKYLRREGAAKFGRMENILSGNLLGSSGSGAEQLSNNIYTLSFLAGTPILVVGTYSRKLVDKVKGGVSEAIKKLRELESIADDPVKFSEAKLEFKDIDIFNMYKLSTVEVLDGGKSNTENFYETTQGSKDAKDFLTGTDPCEEVLELKAAYGEFIEAIKSLEAKIAVDGSDVEPDVAKKLRGISKELSSALTDVSRSLNSIEKFIAVAKANQARISAYMEKINHACKMYVKYTEVSGEWDRHEDFHDLVKGSYFCQ